jgi:LysR family transcriptional activator of nhaA
MRDFSFHHLRYFWHVVKEGGVSAAARHLHVTQSTISTQVRELERALGHPLLERKGRRVVATPAGRIALRYADEIMALGRELQSALDSGADGGPLALRVGVSDVVPKLVAHQALRPALALPQPVRLTVGEDKAERLLADLAAHVYDLVLIDHPVPPGSVHAHHHLLAESTISFLAPTEQAPSLRRRFPKCLGETPMLLPAEGSLMRRELDQWFQQHGMTPQVVGEFVDHALLKVFAESGSGICPVPTIMVDDAVARYRMVSLGRIEALRVRFYAVSLERRVTHPAVMAIIAAARANRTLRQRAP